MTNPLRALRRRAYTRTVRALAGVLWRASHSPTNASTREDA